MGKLTYTLDSGEQLQCQLELSDTMFEDSQMHRTGWNELFTILSNEIKAQKELK